MLTKETPYFSHDSNASEDPKIVRAEKLFGDIAYAWFFKTLEILRQQRDLKLLLRDADILHTKVKCQSPQMYYSFITTSGLFDFDDMYFWSNSLIARVGNTLLSSQKRSKAANIRWAKFYSLNGNNEKAMSYLALAEMTAVENNQNEILPLSRTTKNTQLPQVVQTTINNNPQNSPQTNQPLLSDHIVLPEVPFLLTQNAQVSWRNCLLNCSRSYEEIQRIYHHITKDEHESYKKFNAVIDDAQAKIDIRSIRIANIQVDIQSYAKLYRNYANKNAILEAMIKYVKSGVKQDHSIYSKIEQYIQYVFEDYKKAGNGASVNNATQANGKVLIDGFYYENGRKILDIDINDSEQCKQLLKIIYNKDMNDSEVASLRAEKGDVAFKKMMEI